MLFRSKVVFVATFDLEFGFSLRERKPATLDDAQADALEFEANFASTGKSKGRSEQDTRRRGKEEASTSNQDRDSANEKMEEMRKLIKKMVKLELEAKNSTYKNFQNAPNRGYNPQYRKPPLQILPREAKEQHDQVPHPLYLEGPIDDSIEDIAYGLEDTNLAFSNSDGEEFPLQGNDEAGCSSQK